MFDLFCDEVETADFRDVEGEPAEHGFVGAGRTDDGDVGVTVDAASVGPVPEVVDYNFLADSCAIAWCAGCRRKRGLVLL